MEVESLGHQQDFKSFALLIYGMTSGLVWEGDGASVGETELGIWLEHVWFKHALFLHKSLDLFRKRRLNCIFLSHLSLIHISHIIILLIS